MAKRPAFEDGVTAGEVAPVGVRPCAEDACGASVRVVDELDLRGATRERRKRFADVDPVCLNGDLREQATMAGETARESERMRNAAALGRAETREREVEDIAAAVLGGKPVSKPCRAGRCADDCEGGALGRVG